MNCLSDDVFYCEIEVLRTSFIHTTLISLATPVVFTLPLAGLGSITIVIVIDCNRLQLERNRNCNRNQIFQIVA